MESGFFSCSRYNLTETATLYLRHYLTHYVAKTQTIQYIIQILEVMLLSAREIVNRFQNLVSKMLFATLYPKITLF